MRTTAIGALTLVGALTFASIRQGAYHESQHQLFAIVMGAAGVVLLVVDRKWRPLRFAAIVMTPLLASTILSTLLADDRNDSASTFLTIALVGVALAVGTALDNERRQLAIVGVLGVAGLIAATAIWGVAFHDAPWGRITEGTWRGSSSITYANGAAAVVGPCAALAFRLAMAAHRWFYVPVATFLLIGLAATQSRGGALAFGLVALGALIFCNRDAFARTALAVVVGCAVGTIPLLAFASTDSPTNPGLVFGAIAIGVGVSAGIARIRESLQYPWSTLAAIALGSVVVLASTGVSDQLTARLTLRSGTTAGGQDAGVLFGDRAQGWSTAWDQFTQAPILGHGPGNVDLVWTEGGRTFQALFVHNEFLELGVTHGVVGVLALVMSAGLVFRSWRHDDVVAAAVGVALAMFLVHSLVDFLWHIPLLPVLFAFLVGLAMSSPSPVHEEEPSIEVPVYEARR